MLQNGAFKIVYSTGETDPIDFYTEALLESNHLDLCLGFFSTSGFRVLNYGFAYFLSQGGTLRLVINNILTPEDKDAIQKGIDSNIDAIFENRLLSNIEELKNSLSKKNQHFYKCISWLISQKRLSLISIVPAHNKPGIAHHKFGIFSDKVSDKVAFSGSLNFSESALLYNLETISCYRSWTDEKARVDYYNTLFRRIWLGQNTSVRFLPIEKIRTQISSAFPAPDLDELLKQELEIINDEFYDDKDIPDLPNGLRKIKKRILDQLGKGIAKDDDSPKPRDYQSEAMRNWKTNGYQGFFEMATGTGKTFTALFASLELKNNLNNCFLLILVPTISLAEQWSTEVKKVGYHSIVIANSSQRNWDQNLTRVLNNFKLKTIDQGVCITTYETYKSTRFEVFKNKFPKNTFLIADEAHSMGAPKMLEDLPYYLNYRLGLSATPHRHFDDSGTRRLLTFFNAEKESTFKLDLKEAIREEFLCQYKLYPHQAILNEVEYQSYIKLTKEISRKANIKNDKFEESNAYLEKLLRDRRNILNRASDKFRVLNQIIDDVKSRHGSVKHTLVYCPEGKNDEENDNIIDLYGRFLGMEKGLRIAKFTGETSPDDRMEILDDFEAGKVDCILAMKCLDEGVDVKQTKIAIFLASSTNPRQYIQRRGRVLRTHKTKSFAELHDILAIPPETLEDEKLLKVEKTIIKQELSRYKEFAEDALNYVEATRPLKPILEKYEIEL